jgi:NAD kinase
MLQRDKIVVVTRKTRLEELIERFNTRKQAKFYIEHNGLDFSDYEKEHEVYTQSLGKLTREVAKFERRIQQIDWTFLPNFIFVPEDLVITVGRDGLVVNTAKYLEGQLIVAVNPDPSRNDGILLPFTADTAPAGVGRALEGKAHCHEITMAQVRLNDGQNLLAVNDFYIGQRTHISSRYSLTWHRRTERQSSSGVLVSTGAGSTGWLSSTQNMAAAVTGLLEGKQHQVPRLRLRWDDPRLVFVVREPFQSRASGVRLAAGMIDADEELQLESHMPDGGVIFSDGVEADALAFNAGTVASICAADRKTRLVAA